MIANIVKYSFLQNALIVGVILSFILPIIGIIVLFRKVPFIADALGHINMSAIAFIYFLNSFFAVSYFSSLIIIIIWSIMGAILIEYFSQKFDHYKEVSVMIVYSVAVSLTMILLNLSVGFQSSLFNVLFGNINTITRLETITILISSLVIILIVSLTYKKIILISLEDTNSRIYDVNLNFYKYLSIIIISISISMAIKILGVLLVSSLILIPNLAAIRISKSLKEMVFFSIIFTLISTVSGIVIAYYLSLSTSAVIVLIAVFIYLSSLIIKKK